ncbi:MAG: SURF1 family protein [Silicimonas sp.]|nr:SURF1 family protein [Silicimonas sp.]
MRRFIVPLILGVGGCAVLAAFGFWQLARLEWKEGILAEIEARIAGPEIALPLEPDAEAYRFQPVAVSGRFDGNDVPVFLSHSGGPVYRLVASFETDGGRRIMVDRGAISALEPLTEARRTAPGLAQVQGNLHWPDEVDDWTPEPDANGTLYGRDIPLMARLLETEPMLVVAREITPNTPPTTPLPVTTSGIPNNHLGYAVQWFGLALVWAGMTFFLLWRTAKRSD